jgi:flagellar hook-associated protein 2
MAINTNLAFALGAGSGVDTRSLAQGLVEAERAPRQQLIQAKITRSEARVSGMGALMAISNNLKTAFEGLNVMGRFNSFSVFNSQPNLFSVSTTTTAKPGSYSIEVLSLASPQRTASLGFQDAKSELNNGAAFSLSISSSGGEVRSVRVGASRSNPEGIVAAINEANLGITAQLLNTGQGSEPYKIVLVGQEGEENAFSVVSDDGSGEGQVQKLVFEEATQTGVITVAGVPVEVNAGDTGAIIAGKVKSALDESPFITTVIGRSAFINADGSLGIRYAPSDGNAPDTRFNGSTAGVVATVSKAADFVPGNSVAGVSFDTDLKSASNAVARIDGLTVTRQSNSLADVIPGISVDLFGVSGTNQPAILNISRDLKPIEEKITTLINAFNDAVSDIAILTGKKNPDDPEDVFSGSLQADSTARSLLSRFRQMVTQTVTPNDGSGFKALQDIGVELGRDGRLSLNTAKFNREAGKNFDGMVNLLTGGLSFQSMSGDANRGVAGQAVKDLTDLMKREGPIVSQSKSAEDQIARHKRDLERLEDRMKLLLNRYTKQFSIMDTIVGRLNQQREGLAGTFESLANAYKKK